jgi:hypothetical protein
MKQMMHQANSNPLKLRQMENSRKMMRIKRKSKKSLKKNQKKKHPKKTGTRSKDLLKRARQKLTRLRLRAKGWCSALSWAYSNMIFVKLGSRSHLIQS